MRREWEESHAVSEELVAGPPSRRANATFTACPSGNYLWCIGGEFFSEDGKAVCLMISHSHLKCPSAAQYFYQDVFRYNPEKVSPMFGFIDLDGLTILFRMSGGNLFQRMRLGLGQRMQWSLRQLAEVNCFCSVCVIQRSPVLCSP